jgi:hypothetical protein
MRKIFVPAALAAVALVAAVAAYAGNGPAMTRRRRTR